MWILDGRLISAQDWVTAIAPIAKAFLDFTAYFTLVDKSERRICLNERKAPPIFNFILTERGHVRCTSQSSHASHGGDANECIRRF